MGVRSRWTNWGVPGPIPQKFPNRNRSRSTISNPNKDFCQNWVCKYLPYLLEDNSVFSRKSLNHTKKSKENRGETMNTLSCSVLFYLFRLFDLIYSICSAMASFYFICCCPSFYVWKQQYK